MSGFDERLCAMRQDGDIYTVGQVYSLVKATRDRYVKLGQRAVAVACIAAAAIGFIVGRAQAETVDGDRITIIDGDTVALPCDPAKGIYPGCAERIRLVGIDAPETWKPRCEAERIRGLEAKATLAELLRGRPVEVTRTGRDRYGRTLARLKAGDTDVDAAMLEASLAVPYAPGRAAWAARCRHWCPGAPRCEE